MTPPRTDNKPAIVWFRRDLRLADNPALDAAVRNGHPIVPVFVLDDSGESGRPRGGAALWWLHHGLRSLAGDLESRGSRLLLRRGKPSDVIPALVGETGAAAVFWNTRFEPAARDADRALATGLEKQGVAVSCFNGSLLAAPEAVANRSGEPYKVFTPYWQALRATIDPPPPLPAPGRLTAPASWPDGDDLDAWSLLPGAPDWAGGLRAAWDGGDGAGEAAAQARLADFADRALAGYETGRDRPGRDGTSRLSPHLQAGQVSPGQVWHACDGPGGEALRRELGWRDFAHHVLHHHPALAAEPLDGKFAAFPWEPDGSRLRAWQQGRTGYPFVDAGMRELWATGHMHNRVRMVAASFLIKHLMQPWQDGERWFWDTLVDADPASNPFNWQWVAGCGADAAPFFRIFNPVLQGRKFDPDGAYVRRWVPEIANLPDKVLHAPWEAPPLELSSRGVILGRDYPEPIVDHKMAREKVLAAFKGLSRQRPAPG